MIHHSSAPWHKVSPHYLALKSRFRPFFIDICPRLGAKAANDQMGSLDTLRQERAGPYQLSIGYTLKARLLSDLFNRAPKARGE